MLRRSLGGMMSLAVTAVVVGCSANYDVDGPGSADDLEQVSEVSEAAAACVGDDVKYDYNAFSASLAVAVANEMKRWDVSSDFEVRGGKLELSATGTLRCAGACPNVNALLRLQDDAAGSVPNHSPAVYRNKLTAWYAQQKAKLTDLVNDMLYVDKGIYRLRSVRSGKYMAVNNGASGNWVGIEQKSSVAQAGADQWRLILEGTTHRFINVRSGKCLALSNDGAGEEQLVQWTCEPSGTQKFDFALVSPGTFAIRTKYGKAIDVFHNSTAEDAAVIQYSWAGLSVNQQWKFEAYGSGAHIDPIAVATAVYTMTVKHSGKTLGVAGGSMNDGALIEQSAYVASDDRFHWYVIRNGTSYQLVNRRSGKCMGLQSDTDTSRLVQQTCNWSVAGQVFTFNPVGDGDFSQVLWTKFGRMVEVQGASTANGALLGQGLGGWDHNRQITLTPILAGEPHRLTYAYKTNDAACGEYNYWYNIVKPNGQPLDFPQDTWVQLIFAGGKQSASGRDVNPFIAQRTSGNLVAIDPTGGLNEGSLASSGSCSSACTQYSANSVIGSCCSCNGVNRTFVRSSFSSAIYLCTR